MNERTSALFVALEHRADRRLAELAEARELIARLEGRNLQLEQQNRELEQQVAQLDRSASHPATSSGGRSQGLAALMARRPRPVQAHPEPPESAGADSPSEPAPSPVAPEETPPPAAPSPVPPRDAKDAGPNGAVAEQGDLPIGEAPSPQALLDEWYHRYGDTFFKGHTRPLKVGIHEDLVAREPWPEKLVRRALACYVHLPRYLKAVREGAERVGLEGESAGLVTAGEAKYAHRQLDELRAQSRSRQARREQHKEQQAKHDRLERKLGELLAKHER